MLRFLVLTGVMACVAAIGSDAAEDPHHAHFVKCANTCADCQLQCDMCFHHCSLMVADGQKDYAACMHLCVNCADCCKLAATLSARHSPLTGAAAECCAKCCDECAKACEKFPNDKEMAACAKECRECAKECHEMVKDLAK